MACVVACAGDPRCFERDCALQEGVEVDALLQLLECTGFCTDQGCLNSCPELGIMCMAGGEFGSFECSFGIECGFSCEGDPFCERDCRVQMDPEAQLRYFLLSSCVAPICQGDLECQLEVAFDFCPKEADLCFNQP